MTLRGFDKSFYLDAKLGLLSAQNPEWSDKETSFLEDVILNIYGLSPEMHYQLYGYNEGLAPNAFFNHDEYRLAKAADLVSKGIALSMEDALETFSNLWQGDIYQHYLQYGAAEGINPSNSFDESTYLANKLTALQSGESTATQWAGKTINDLRDYFSNLNISVIEHYLNYGIIEGITVKAVPEDAQPDSTDTLEELPHDYVVLPEGLSLDWVDNSEIIASPYNAIGLVSVVLGSQGSLGTGFLISPEHILTSAHVLLDDSGDFDSNKVITFYSGLNGDITQASSYEAETVWLENTFDSKLYPSWPDNDLAIIKLDQAIGESIGYLNLEQFVETSLVNTAVQSAGYASDGLQQDNPDTPGQDYYQWEVTGDIDGYLFSNHVLDLSDTMEVTAGASGSPIFYVQDENAYFTGVLAGTIGDDTVAAAIDSDSYNWILGIVQQDGYYTDYTL